MSNEVVTLQLGHYSNFVGTHWWNLQEASFVYDKSTPTDINHDVLYREGCTLQGESTFLPRLIVVDLKGSLNSLREDSVLYGNRKKLPIVPWAGEVVIHKTEPIEKNEFLQDLENEEIESSSLVEAGCDSDPEKDICQASLTEEQDDTDVKSRLYNLEDSINVWSDFLRVRFHPKSIFLIEQYSHGNTLDAFDTYGLGQQVWAQETTSEPLEDRIRFFCEECDHLQGFQMLVDPFDGFAGIAHGIISLLRDEYSSKSILTVPTFPAVFSDDKPIANVHRQFNTVFALDYLSTASSLVIPMSLASSFTSKGSACRMFPHLSYNDNLMYHTSAILAAALEASTTPYRLKKDPLSLTDLAASMTPVGMKIAAQSLCVPFPVQNNSLDRSLQQLNPVLESLTPGTSLKRFPSILQSIIARGLCDVSLQSYTSLKNKPQKKGDTLKEMLGTYLATCHPSSCSILKTACEACATTAPFPNIFSSCIASNGFLTEEPRDHSPVNSVPVVGGIHCNQGVQNTLHELCTATERLDLKKFHSFSSSGVEADDFKEVIESLKSLMYIYTNECN